jgi:hypothetical protein
VEHGGLVASRAADHLHADGKAGAATIGGGGGTEHWVEAPRAVPLLVSPNGRHRHGTGWQVKQVGQQAWRRSEHEPGRAPLAKRRHRRHGADHRIAASDGRREPRRQGVAGGDQARTFRRCASACPQHAFRLAPVAREPEHGRHKRPPATRQAGDREEFPDALRRATSGEKPPHVVATVGGHDPEQQPGRLSGDVTGHTDNLEPVRLEPCHRLMHGARDGG